MNNPFDVLVYLDDTLVKNLAALVLTGYIETVTRTLLVDRSLEAAMKEEDRIENSNQGSLTKIEHEGFKDRNESDACNEFNHYQLYKDIDAKHLIREQLQVQTTFTTFVLNGNLMDYFNQNNKLHHKDVLDIENDNIEVGDMIEIEGNITNLCISTYVETLINLIEAFGCDYLNELTKECKCTMKFEVFSKMLAFLKKTLDCNNTQDLIMESGNGKAILTVNKGNFLNSSCNIFDKINCHCKVVGKVVKTCTSEEDTISLLRKTGQEDFYEKFFEMSMPLLECLKNNGIMIPQCPDLRLNKSAIQIMPLNIYM